MAKRFDSVTVQDGIAWLVNRDYTETNRDLPLEYELVQMENEQYMKRFLTENDERKKESANRIQTSSKHVCVYDEVLDMDMYEKLMNKN